MHNEEMQLHQMIANSLASSAQAKRSASKIRALMRQTSAPTSSSSLRMTGLHSTVATTASTTYYYATGNFSTGVHNIQIYYRIKYDIGSSGSINCVYYNVWTATNQYSNGTLYWSWIDWAANYDGPCTLLTSAGDSTSLNWTGGSGNKFTTDVNDSSSCNEVYGTDYQGWVYIYS